MRLTQHKHEHACTHSQRLEGARAWRAPLRLKDESGALEVGALPDVGTLPKVQNVGIFHERHVVRHVRVTPHAEEGLFEIGEEDE